MNDWNIQLKKVEKENGFYPHNEQHHPFPWKTYKTSDNLIVLRNNNRRWYEFWKSTHQVLVGVDKYDVKDENKCYFISIDKWGGDCDYDKKDLIILDLPILKRN